MTKIPSVCVIEWKFKGIFGRVKQTWVLPSVKVTVPSGAQRRLTNRKYGIGPNGAKGHV